jgi:hypothetical protein
MMALENMERPSCAGIGRRKTLVRDAMPTADYLRSGKMLETKALTILFAVLLAGAGITGEVSGFRAFVCSRNSRELGRRLVLIVGLYLAISLFLALLLTRLISLSNWIYIARQR